jgi:hypothetical protein
MNFLSSPNSKRDMLLITALSFCILFASCKQNTGSTTATDKIVKDTAAGTAAVKPQTESSIPPLAELQDNGKPFFKVAVYKQNKPFVAYEGDWAIVLQAGKNMNIQFSASKHLMKLTHGMTLYFNSPSEGSFPIAPSGNEKGKPVVIFTPEEDGAVGLAVSPSSGTVKITKYSNSLISGTIEASGKDVNGAAVFIQAAFINLKNNVVE